MFGKAIMTHFNIGHWADNLKNCSRYMLVALLWAAACTPSAKTENKPDDLIPFKIVKAFPHDITAYTQGLTIANGKLYESTGQAGSWISEVDIVTGKQNKKVILDDKYFGEGITILNNKMYQLTWQHKIGFVYDIKSFKKISEFNYNHEGWGITHDGTYLIVSDGTERLHFLDTVDLKEVKAISVSRKGQPASQLNELEYVDGFIYANQYQTNFILKIDATTGNVMGVLDFTSVNDEILKFNVNPDVLNGIAYEKKSKTFLVTGKLWPVLFALKLGDETAVEGKK
jgi:glutaminyl-peptide cyclotransferase